MRIAMALVHIVHLCLASLHVNYTGNATGAVVGWYVDANGAFHGFIYQSEHD